MAVAYAEVKHLHQAHGPLDAIHPEYGAFALPPNSHQIRNLVKIIYRDEALVLIERLAVGLIPPHKTIRGVGNNWIVLTGPDRTDGYGNRKWIPLEWTESWEEIVEEPVEA